MSLKTQDLIYAGIVSGLVTGVVLYLILTRIPQEVAKMEEEVEVAAAVPSW